MTENMSFFDCEEIFLVRKVLPRGSSYDYWISKTNDREIINKRFLRQELFALKNQFTYMDPIFIYYNNLKFAKNKPLTLEFSNGDAL